jgi:hypothetical protein
MRPGADVLRKMTRLPLFASYSRCSLAALVQHHRQVSAVDLVRSLPGWYASQRRPSSPSDDRIPWMTFRAIRFLRSYLKPGMRVFEYGVGGSTGFFLDHGCELVSVEHDDEWAERARRAFCDDDRWQLYIKTPAPGDIVDPADPYLYGSRKYDATSFAEYVQVIDAYDPFDVVVVDGRARAAALRHAAARLAPGGILLLDDAERKRYARGAALVDGRNWNRQDWFGPCPYSNYFSQTTIWRRPRDDTSAEPQSA